MNQSSNRPVLIIYLHRYTKTIAPPKTPTPNSTGLLSPCGARGGVRAAGGGIGSIEKGWAKPFCVDSRGYEVAACSVSYLTSFDRSNNDHILVSVQEGYCNILTSCSNKDNKD